MKLKELAIDGFGTRRDLRLGGFDDGLSIVYGENGAGKTTVREFIRGTLFDINGSLPVNTRHSAGRLKVTNGRNEFQLSRDVQLNSEVDIQALTDVNSDGRFDTIQSLEQLAGSLNVELYDSVFSVSFRETPTNAVRLARVLQDQLGVPSGPETAGDDSGYLGWQRDTKVRQQQIESLRMRIAGLNSERNGYVNQIESYRSDRQEQVEQIERQLSRVQTRLNEIQASPYQDQLKSVEREIAQLRELIANEQKQVTHIAPDDFPSGLCSALYQRLDEIDNQIRRWRHIQADIQNQRVRLRDEMLVWNELTLDSDEHPYHHARAILVALESKVDEAERNANHWGDAAASRVDTSQMARTLGSLCQSMRDDLYGLCNELAHQYKHLRHKAAAAELRQLRRCYGELGDNIQYLIQRREALIHEIRELDPAGAEPILRSDHAFNECAQHNGYLEARKRFVGKVARPIADSPSHAKSTNLPLEHHRLAILKQERRDLISTSANVETELIQLNARRAELIRQRDAIRGEVNVNDLNLKLHGIDDQLKLLNHELGELLRLVELNRDFLPAHPNALIHSACGLLGRISGGDLSQVFLSEPYRSLDGEREVGLQVRDRFGKVLNFSAIDPGLQDQTYLCLMLAAKEQLQRQCVQIPTVIDDAFCRIPTERITATLNGLKEFASQSHQIVILTQHRYLSDRVPGVPLLELPPTMPAVEPFSNPDRRSVTGPNTNPAPETVWNPDSSMTTEVYASSSLPRPYPLSKYPRSNSARPILDYDDAISFPFPVSGQNFGGGVSSHVTSARPASPVVSPVAVSSIGDRLGYVSSIDGFTKLEKIGFFEPGQLRSFQANGIESVADLMSIEPNQITKLGFHAEQVERWQSQLWLLVNLPGMRISDARVLVACGVTDPQQIDTSHPQQILERIERFFSTMEGRRFAQGADSISIERVNGWYRSLDATRPQWSEGTGSRLGSNAVRDRDVAEPVIHTESIRSNSSPFEEKARTYQPRPDADLGQPSHPVRAPRMARPPRMNTPFTERKIVPRVAPASQLATQKTARQNPAKIPQVVANRKLKFFLDLTDHVEAAPSIGPKTAERFEKIGIVTVTDFLKQTAESMATKIKYKRISADLIRQWQHQARLVCRVPNLRGHDAQLLVACGITEPEELATMQPKNLFNIIGPFSETKEGLKIIRNGKKPDLAEVSQWISWAEQTRSLQAA